ncbi:MAG: type II toxin-antitoxin system RelE/ParE family toxin [Candidatus Omnitrophica bacterium]|nr:type II toxin-antitoxin system RelE/ParE family toxin [Candidatus Omnitrophota bacterium]MBI2496069.1 type II toxin-antitoxin system RelE/ParE family toxin [Candidatus Omnitrophota bacterium]
MWQVEIHPLVWEEDFARLDPQARIRITKAIRQKLTTHPTEFGKPLSGPLRGYWRLRVDAYRVMYRIEHQRLVVLVIKVGMRRDALIYTEAIPRLRKLGWL